MPVNKFPSHKAFLGELFCSMLKVKPLKYYIIGSSIHKIVLRKRGVIPWLMRDQHIFALYYNFGIYDRHTKIVEFAIGNDIHKNNTYPNHSKTIYTTQMYNGEKYSTTYYVVLIQRSC